MATLICADYHCVLQWEVLQARYEEPRKSLKHDLSAATAKGWHAYWICRVQQRKGKRRRAVHRLQVGLLSSFSISSQDEKWVTASTGIVRPPSHDSLRYRLPTPFHILAEVTFSALRLIG